MADFYTVGDVARLWGKSPDLVRHAEKTGQIKAMRTVGRGVRFFRREEVEKFLASRKKRQDAVIVEAGPR